MTGSEGMDQLAGETALREELGRAARSVGASGRSFASPPADARSSVASLSVRSDMIHKSFRSKARTSYTNTRRAAGRHGNGEAGTEG